MEQSPMDRAAIIQNLEDAGCSGPFIQQYLKTVETRGGGPERLRLLEERRRDLLSRLHAEQRKLDCLDYLRYQLQKEQDPPQKG